MSDDKYAKCPRCGWYALFGYCRNCGYEGEVMSESWEAAKARLERIMGGTLVDGYGHERFVRPEDRADVAALLARVEELERGRLTFADQRNQASALDLAIMRAEKAEAALTDLQGKFTEHDSAAQNLLAVLHRDGGHHTVEVGFVQSCKDGEQVRHNFVLDMGKLWGEIHDLQGKYVEQNMRLGEALAELVETRKCLGEALGLLPDHWEKKKEFMLRLSAKKAEPADAPHTCPHCGKGWRYRHSCVPPAEPSVAEPVLPLGHEFVACNVPGCGICGECQHVSADYRRVCAQPASAHRASPEPASPEPIEIYREHITPMVLPTPHEYVEQLEAQLGVARRLHHLADGTLVAKPDECEVCAYYAAQPEPGT